MISAPTSTSTQGTQKTGYCWNCGHLIEANNFARQDSCVKCGRDTKVCKNCGFFDPAYNNMCRENQADRIVEKEKANFCDYFYPQTEKPGQPSSTLDAAKAAAEALFKKK